jgi:hypothetical protein
MEAKPVRPYETQRYEIYNKQTGNSLEVAGAKVDNDEDAETFLNDYILHGPHRLQQAQAMAMFGIRRVGNKSVSARAGEPVPAGSVGQTTNVPFVWKVIGSNRSPYQIQGIEVVANSEFEAMQKARQQWNLNTSGDTEEEFFRSNGWRASAVRPAPPRPIPGVIDIEPDVTPGSTRDLQQQRASGGFTGAWKVLDGLGREVHRFSGIGNSQADANRVAADWMRQNGRGGNFEVLPIMG